MLKTIFCNKNSTKRRLGSVDISKKSAKPTYLIASGASRRTGANINPTLKVSNKSGTYSSPSGTQNIWIINVGILPTLLNQSLSATKHFKNLLCQQNLMMYFIQMKISLKLLNKKQS